MGVSLHRNVGPESRLSRAAGRTPAALFSRNMSSAYPEPIKTVDSFAVVMIKGKQHKVSADCVVMTDKLDAEVGSEIVFTDVLLAGRADGTTLIGRPLIDGASVTVTVQEQTESAKVNVFKKKRRKNYRRWNGHKQQITLLNVESVNVDFPVSA